MEYKIAGFDERVTKKSLTRAAEVWKQSARRLEIGSKIYQQTRGQAALCELGAQGIEDEEDALRLLHSTRVTVDTASLLDNAVVLGFPTGEEWKRFVEKERPELYIGTEFDTVRQVVELCADDPDMRLGLARFARKHLDQVQSLHPRTKQRLIELGKLKDD